MAPQPKPKSSTDETAADPDKNARLETYEQELEPPRVELAVEALDERERIAAEDLLGRRDGHQNCASSVLPVSASVDESGETACATRSK